MKTTPRQFRLTAEDLDNIRFIKQYYAERDYTDTDVIRTTLRDRRLILELSEDSGAIYPHTDEDDRLPFNFNECNGE